MSTVIRRTFTSSPVRDAHETWTAIVALLTKACPQAVRDELVAVSGTATSIISDQAPGKVPIVVTCDGPRTRLYCIYDDDALDGSDSNEEALSYDPLKGNWAISLPCPAEDLSWVQASLGRHSERITARDMADAASATRENKSEASVGLTFNPAGFLGS